MLTCLKLSTGEDIVAHTNVNMSGDYDIEHPFQVVPIPESANRYTLALVPYLRHASSPKFTLPKALVYFTFEPNPDMINLYARVTAEPSKIIPGKSPILTLE